MLLIYFVPVFRLTFNRFLLLFCLNNSEKEDNKVRLLFHGTA